MKKLLPFMLFAATLFCGKTSGQNLQYVDSVYARSTIVRTSNVMYADGYSVLKYPSIYIDTLRFDWYNPTGNTGSKRPLIIMSHTGSFLPRYLNKLPTGERDDSATVEMATRLAMRGYVVAVMSYRLGWNPLATKEEDRKSSIINAAYKAVQDMNACIRYFKKSVAAGGNPYGIDTTKICTGGQGTGGYITLVQATLSSQADIKIDKFVDFSGTTPVAMVNDTIWGDRLGYKMFPTTPYCRENHKGYTNNVAVSFEFGGAIGDISWLDSLETPMICAHALYDPFAPYKTGMVKVPGTNNNVVEVSGGYDIMKKVNQYGNNKCYKGKVNDWYTKRADQLNDNLEGLFPIDGLANASAAWEWWDTVKIKALPSPPYDPPTIIANGNAANPLHQMYGKSRAIKYIDTLIGYFAPRVAVCMGLQASVGIVKTDLASNVNISPNPAHNQLIIHNSWSNNPLNGAVLMDMNGRVVKRLSVAGDYNVVTLDVPAGMYLVQLQFANGTGVKKLIVE